MLGLQGKCIFDLRKINSIKAFQIYLTGVVVYKTDSPGDSFKLSPGMAIEFKEIGDKETEMLRGYIRRALD